MQVVRRIAKAPSDPSNLLEGFATCFSWLPKYLAKLPSHSSDLTLELDAFVEYLTVLASHFSCFTNPLVDRGNGS